MSLSILEAAKLVADELAKLPEVDTRALDALALITGAHTSKDKSIELLEEQRTELRRERDWLSAQLMAKSEALTDVKRHLRMLGQI